ncbi:MAG: topoisomerase [Firmicutes bacterium]|nr:topoisomerase [Bacillota bacterium]
MTGWHASRRHHAEPEYVVIVEGKHDRARVRQVLPDSIPVLTTNGIPSGDRLDRLQKAVGPAMVVILTDADASGRRIRGILREVFPDALHVYTRPSFGGVEHTPVEYLGERFRRLGLLEHEE